MSRDSLIKGTLVLALAAFVARFLGMVVRIPLLHLLGNEGMAAYVIANNIYLVLLLVATAGIPSALSKLISERLALGREEEANRIFRAAIMFSVSAGVVMTVVLYGSAPAYARLIGNPDAMAAVRALAPALLLFPTIAIMRGFFQGRQNMTAGAISQIFEQFARVGGGVLLAWLLLYFGYGRDLAAAGASFGGVLGSVAAFAVMLFYWRKLKQNGARLEASSASSLKLRDIYRHLFALSVPIALFSMAVPLVQTIDSSTVIQLLQPRLGTTAAKETLGLLGGKAQPIAGIPPILAIALSMSIVPIVSSAYARNDMEEVEAKASQTLRISVLSGLPLVLMLIAAARPLNGFLFPDLQGTDYMMWMTSASMFQIVMMTSGAILMGMGKTWAPMVNVMAGVAVKLAGSFALAPLFGIYGIMAATIACFVTVMLLNLIRLRRWVSFQVLGRKWIGLAAAAGLAMLTGWLAETLTYRYNPLVTSMSTAGFAVNGMIVGLLVFAVYVFVLWRTKVVSVTDLQSFPAPVRKAVRWLSRTSRVSQSHD